MKLEDPTAKNFDALSAQAVDRLREAKSYQLDAVRSFVTDASSIMTRFREINQLVESAPEALLSDAQQRFLDTASETGQAVERIANFSQEDVLAAADRAAQAVGQAVESLTSTETDVTHETPI